jgi:hypothetical protein
MVTLSGMNQFRLLTIASALLSFQITGARPEASAGVFSAEESKLCAELTLTARPWATARWEVSLTEARRRAEREGKPVFLVVNTGNVLGFV